MRLLRQAAIASLHRHVSGFTMGKCLLAHASARALLECLSSRAARRMHVVDSAAQRLSAFAPRFRESPVTPSYTGMFQNISGD